MRELTANAVISEWLDQHIWPQIQTMLLHDAYFKLMNHARELAKEFNGSIGELIVSGYVISQTVAIRRLCDDRRDVISLRRALIEVKAGANALSNQIDTLLNRLDSCGNICDLVNNYIVHIANPARRPNLGDWNLQVQQITEAQKAISQVAVIFDRDLLQRKNYVRIVPVPQFDIMEEFQSWVPGEQIRMLREFWHTHNEAVNAWAS